MKLGLGTVQFGLPYGITNTEGQVALAEAQAIVKYARQAGIGLMDTAAGYGTSEEILGRCLHTGKEMESAFQIITKTPPLHCSTFTRSERIKVEQSFFSSLRRLRKTSVEGLLVHHVDDILVPGGERLFEILEYWKGEGRIQKWGVSVYNSEQIETVLERYPIDLIQLPVNVFDQRLLKSGVIRALKQRDVEIHARSIFLQGLLIDKIGKIPEKLKPLRAVREKYEKTAKANGLSVLAASMAFIDSVSEIDFAIVGVVSVSQLKSICHAKESLTANTGRCAIDFSEFAINDEALINPSLWQ